MSENRDFVPNGCFVIYNCVHISSLSQLINLRLTRHRKEDAILLMFGQPTTITTGLESEGIFNKVLYYDRDFGCNLTDSIKKSLDDYYNGIFHENKIDPRASMAIYTGCDYFNMFALYLSLNEIWFNNIELQVGQFDDLGRRTDRTKKNTTNTVLSKEINDLQIKTGIIDGHGKFNPIYYNLDHEISDKSIDFIELFNKLDVDDRQKLKKILKMDSDLSNVQLILMSSWNYCAYATVFGIDGYMHMFQLIADYCCDPEIPILVKQHPHDREQMDPYFPNATVLNKDVPMEFLLLHDNITIKTVFGADSSAVTKINNIVEHDRSMGYVAFSLSKLFHHFHAIDLAIGDLGLGRTLKTHITESDVGESKCLSAFFDRSVSFCADGMINDGESLILSEKFVPYLNPHANYFLIDYDDSKWTDSYKKVEMGLVRIGIRIYGKKGFRGVEFDNSIYLLSNEVRTIPTGYEIELSNSSAIAHISYEIIRNPLPAKTKLIQVEIDSPTPALAYDMASAYRNGRYVEKDAEKASALLEIASEKNPWAVTEWFDVLYENRNRLQISKKLISCLEKISEDDSGAGYSCKYRLAKLYLTGTYVEKNTDKAIKMYYEASYVNTWAIADMFDTFYENKDTMTIPDGFVKRIQTLSESDSDLAYEYKFRLAKLYAEGLGVKKDIDKASELFKIASNTIPWATTSWFYNIWWNSDQNVPDELVEKLKTLAAKDSEICYVASDCLGNYYNGDRGINDPLAAIKYFRKAALKNYGAAITCYDLMVKNSIPADAELLDIVRPHIDSKTEKNKIPGIIAKIRAIFKR